MNYTIETNRIYLENKDGKLLAEITFPAVKNNLVDINHTSVDSSLLGQGIAGELLSLTATELRNSGRKAVLSCSYAIHWFKKHPENADLLSLV